MNYYFSRKGCLHTVPIKKKISSKNRYITLPILQKGNEYDKILANIGLMEHGNSVVNLT